MLRQQYNYEFVWAVLLSALFALVTIFMIFWMAFTAYAADNNVPCYTKEQARAKWPKAVLYWHTANRCWDNISIKRAHTVVAARMITQEEIDELQVRHEAERRLRTCCWPPLPAFEVWQERIQGLVNDK